MCKVIILSIFSFRIRKCSGLWFGTFFWGWKKLFEIKPPAFLHANLPNQTLHQTRPSLKIGSVNKVSLFWYWQQLKKDFFRNICFLFFKIESWNFQNLFHETSQNFNLFRIFLFSFLLSVVWLSWNLARFHEMLL